MHTRLVIDIDSNENNLFVIKEVVAMALEPFGNVRVVGVMQDGKEQK